MAIPKIRVKRIIVYVVVACFCLFSASPFLVMAIHTFKQDRDLYRPQNNPFIYNDPPTLDHLRLLFLETNYTGFLWNSFLVGVLVVIITLIVAIPAAYSLARLVGHWGERAGIGMFLIYLVPPTLLFIPLFRMVVIFGLNDSVWSLVLVVSKGFLKANHKVNRRVM